MSIFLEEFNDIATNVMLASGRTLIEGDFNLHIDDISDRDAMEFLKHLEILHLEQHVHKPTHEAGHILDLIITQANNGRSLCNNLIVDDMLSDHSVVLCNLDMSKPTKEKKLIP